MLWTNTQTEIALKIDFENMQKQLLAKVGLERGRYLIYLLVELLTKQIHKLSRFYLHELYLTRYSNVSNLCWSQGTLLLGGYSNTYATCGVCFVRDGSANTCVYNVCVCVYVTVQGKSAHSTQINHFVIRAKIVGRVKYRTISKCNHLPCYSRKTEFIAPFVGPAMAFSTQLLHRAEKYRGVRLQKSCSSRVSIGNIVLE